MIHVYLIIQHQLLCVALLIFHELSSSAPWEVSPSINHYLNRVYILFSKVKLYESCFFVNKVKNLYYVMSEHFLGITEQPGST